MTHQAKTVNKFSTGMVLYQPDQILNDDAFPILNNAFVDRNRVKRRQAWNQIGRLTRTFSGEPFTNTSASPWSFNIFTDLSISDSAGQSIQPGSVEIVFATPITFTDQGDGTLTSVTPGNSGTINYSTGAVVLTHTAGAGITTVISFSYYPSLPAMGILDRNTSQGIVGNVYFDTKYAYRETSPGTFTEFLPGTTWSFNDYNFPYPTNYAVDQNNFPIFWITADTGTGGDPIRYTNGIALSSWYDFTPTVDGTNNMYQAKILIPFRGRLFAFNTYEGTSLASSINRGNLVRCSAIGTPFTTVSAIVTDVDANAWNDTIPGKGYSQEIPTTETIQSASLVMNQIIIRTNTKSWVLTHTGINAAPFKIDLLDETFGGSAIFSAVNMGGYLLGIANRAVATWSPTTVVSIDDKILDLVFQINRENNGAQRVYGIRDYIARVNSFIYPYQPLDDQEVKFPNRRLIYNYQNQSWAIYEDSLTCLGYYRSQSGITWATANFSWENADFSWVSNSTAEPLVCAGNQQGFIGFIDNGITEGSSLYIQNITPQGSGLGAAIFTSPDHNLPSNAIVQISGIIPDPDGVNGTVAQVTQLDSDTFLLYSYDEARDLFSVPVTFGNGYVYLGGGLITFRRNFNIVTKAFNNLENGQSMHISYLDTLVNTYPNATVELSVYPSLNNSNPVNTAPENDSIGTLFGNAVSLQNPTTYVISEVNNRAIVNQRANMISLGFSLSNATMASDLYSTPFVLSSFTIWQRPAGRPLMPFGGG